MFQVVYCWRVPLCTEAPGRQPPSGNCVWCVDDGVYLCRCAWSGGCACVCVSGCVPTCPGVSMHQLAVPACGVVDQVASPNLGRQSHTLMVQGFRYWCDALRIFTGDNTIVGSGSVHTHSLAGMNQQATSHSQNQACAVACIFLAGVAGGGVSKAFLLICVALADCCQPHTCTAVTYISQDCLGRGWLCLCIHPKHMHLQTSVWAKRLWILWFTDAQGLHIRVRCHRVQLTGLLWMP